MSPEDEFLQPQNSAKPPNPSSTTPSIPPSLPKTPPSSRHMTHDAMIQSQAQMASAAASVPTLPGAQDAVPPAQPVDEPEHAMPAWLESAFPWAVSVTFHLGLGLLFAFVYYTTLQTLTAPEPIVITSFDDPSLAPGTPGGTPNPGLGGDPNRDAAQNRLKELTSGSAEKPSNQSVSSFLTGNDAENQLDLITRGASGTVGQGVNGAGTGDSGQLAPYGTPGGGVGVGPKSTFFGTGGNATRIVYILDHSGSMIDNFDFLKVEATKSVNNLIPAQSFSVVMVAEEAELIGPDHLQRAVPQVKREFVSKLDDIRARGANDELLPPFQKAFEKAFAMKPQLIYFLTDGKFDPRLMQVVNKLNADKKVRINTLAFINHEAGYEDQLRDLAKQNGGVYKFVSDKDLGR